MPASRCSGPRLVAAMLALGVAALGAAPTASAATPSTTPAALPACPEVHGHGGYPSGPNGWERDQVRQPNHPAGLRDYKSMGASGSEVDLQLTKDGHKAVMWHNGTTNALTGSYANVNEIWWNTGADKLNGRTIEVGPYKGERVHTLREFLAAAEELRMVPLIEFKGNGKQSLLNADQGIRDGAWKEALDPIRERIDGMEIMLYTHDEELRPELDKRVKAAGLEATIAGGPQRGVWPDTVLWEEPPPSAAGNEKSWQAALDKGPRRMYTSWMKELSDWLEGKCTPA